MRAPRGFWVPAAVLSRELGLPMPPDFLRNVPRDGLERDLETVAARRLFRVAERVDELDPISRNAVLFLLHDSFGARARYLGAVCRWAMVRPGRKTAPHRLAGARGRGPASGVAALPAVSRRRRARGGRRGLSRPGSRPGRGRETQCPACPCFSCQRAIASPVVNQTPGKRRMYATSSSRSMIREARPITKGWQVRTKHPCSR